MATQLSKSNLAEMSWQQIAQADKNGELDELMGVTPTLVALKEKIAGDEPLSKADFKLLYLEKQYDLIVTLEDSGRFDSFTRKETK